jgi:Lon protease-like protein
MSDDLTTLKHFNGTARLFPLPNLVLFPCARQELHIFEPRYRQMTRDALAADRLIAMVLLRPGWEADYEGRPPLHSVACLGRILAEQRLDDGRYNLLLRGLRRVRLIEEVARDVLYRVAHVELLSDVEPPAGPRPKELRLRLARTAHAWFAGRPDFVAEFVGMCQGDVGLGVLCDILSFHLPLDVEFKQVLLATLDVEQRVRQLLRHLEGRKPPPHAPAPSHRFPPDFSCN